MFEYETKIELCGEALPAVLGYDLDEGDGADSICIFSVRIKRCVAERGNIRYHLDGDYHQAHHPEYVELEIFSFLNGKQIKALAEEINDSLCEKNWDSTMNEPRNYTSRHFPTNFPGVRL